MPAIRNPGRSYPAAYVVIWLALVSTLVQWTPVDAQTVAWYDSTSQLDTKHTLSLSTTPVWADVSQGHQSHSGTYYYGVCVPGEGATQVLQRFSNGTAHAMAVLPSGMASCRGLGWHDINADGLIDLVVHGDRTCSGSCTYTYLERLWWLENPGEGTPITGWPVHTIATGITRGAMSFSVADVNGDGHLDIARGGKKRNWDNNMRLVSVFINQGAASGWTQVDLWKSKSSLKSTKVQPVHTADINADGYADVVACARCDPNYSPLSECRFYASHGDGTFAAAVVIPGTYTLGDFPLGATPISAPVDHAGNGRPGLWVRLSSLDWVWTQWHEPGHFVSSSVAGVESHMQTILAAHADLDDRIDLLALAGDVTKGNLKVNGFTSMTALPLVTCVFDSPHRHNSTYRPVFECPVTVWDSATTPLRGPTFLAPHESQTGLPAMLAVSGTTVVRVGAYAVTGSLSERPHIVSSAPAASLVNITAQNPWTAPLGVTAVAARGVPSGCDDLAAAYLDLESGAWSLLVHTNIECNAARWSLTDTVLVTAELTYVFRDVVAVDLDADGREDIVTLEWDTTAKQQRVRWFRNTFTQGHPAFDLPVTLTGLSAVSYGGSTGAAPRSLHFRDLNGDGLLDAYLWRSYGWCSGAADCNEETWWFARTGPTSFVRSKLNSAKKRTRGSLGIVWTDLNRDGYPEAVVCTHQQTGQVVFWGTGAGSWSSPYLYFASGNHICRAITSGDIDGDGVDDVVWTGYVKATSTPLLYTWRSSQAYMPPAPHPGNVSSLRNTTFVASTSIQELTVVSTPTNIALVDYDSDGDLDVLILDPASGALVWRENTDGAGTWSTQRTLGFYSTRAVRSEQQHLRIAHLNNDTTPDLLVLTSAGTTEPLSAAVCGDCDVRNHMGFGLRVLSGVAPSQAQAPPQIPVNPNATLADPCAARHMRCLQALIDAADPLSRTRITVPAGVWHGCTTASAGLHTRGKAVAIVGATGNPADVVLDFEDGCPGIVMGGVEGRRTRLQGLTLARGRATGSDGGCIHIGPAASPSISNLVIANCTAIADPDTAVGGAGGGIYVGGRVVATELAIHGCTADYGGGIALGSGGVAADTDDHHTLSLTSVNITDCVARYDGGGIWEAHNAFLPTDVPVTLDRVVVRACVAENGGGIATRHGFLVPPEAGPPTWAVDVQGCAATVNGGGIAVMETAPRRTATVAEIARWRISGNTANVAGGGLYALRISLAVTGAFEVRGNTAGETGGGLALEDTNVATHTTQPVIWVAENTAVLHGGGIRVASTAPVDPSSLGVLTDVSLLSANISANVAGASGGGLSINGARIAVQLDASLVSANQVLRGVAGSDPSLVASLSGAAVSLVCPTAAQTLGLCALGGAPVLSVSASTLRDNVVAEASSTGGALAIAGALSINGTSLVGNTAGAGGAIYYVGHLSSVTVQNSLFSHNHAETAGGASFVCVQRCGGAAPVLMHVDEATTVVGSSTNGYGPTHASDAALAEATVAGTARVASGVVLPVIQATLADHYAQRVTHGVSVTASVGGSDAASVRLAGSRTQGGDDTGTVTFADLSLTLLAAATTAAPDRTQWRIQVSFRDASSPGVAAVLPIDVALCNATARVPGSEPDEVVCRQCVPGEQRFMSGCALCPPGTWSGSTDAATCDLCEPGFFAAAPGSPGCAECPAGTVATAPGATDCSVCDTRYATCSRDSVESLPGWFMTDTPAGPAFGRCERDVCLGGNACAENRAGPLCGLCTAGFEMASSGSCVACPQHSGVGVKYLVMGIAMYCLVAVACLLFRISASALSKILLFFLQTLALVMVDAPSGGPDFQLLLFDWETTLDSCVGPIGFYGRLWVAVLTPVVLTLCTVLMLPLVHGLMRTVHRWPRLHSWLAGKVDTTSRPSDRFIKAFWNGVLLTYTPTMRVILTVFNCVEIYPDSKVKLLRADVAIECSTADGSVNPVYARYRMFAIVLAVLYVYAIPLGLVFMLWRQRRRGLFAYVRRMEEELLTTADVDASQDPQTTRLESARIRFGMLFLHVRADIALWFEPFLQMRKAIVMSVIAFSPDVSTRLFALSTTLIILLTIQTQFVPYRHIWQNHLEQLLLLALVVVTSTLSSSWMQESGYSFSEFAAIVGFICVLPALAFAAEVLYRRLYRRAVRVGVQDDKVEEVCLSSDDASTSDPLWLSESKGNQDSDRSQVLVASWSSHGEGAFDSSMELSSRPISSGHSTRTPSALVHD